MDAFSRSDHAFAAEELFNAYRSGASADVKACVAAKPVFQDLDNQVCVCVCVCVCVQACVACTHQLSLLMRCKHKVHGCTQQRLSQQQRPARQHHVKHAEDLSSQRKSMTHGFAFRWPG